MCCMVMSQHIGLQFWQALIRLATRRCLLQPSILSSLLQWHGNADFWGHNKHNQGNNADFWGDNKHNQGNNADFWGDNKHNQGNNADFWGDNKHNQ